ncbi:hypothetical protein AB2B41_07510 [Marimonas sp. MJW-29]|uniref:Uncharacterized protein n=1 Tax=Sulfitobacter sediminis TaxID=3234186 RepID=A0ABV3RKF5_9RHOB
MRRLLISALSGVLLAGPLQAQTFRAENGVIVTPVAGGFEISSGGGQGARGMWCAAADYALDVLGAGGFDRIYIAQGRRLAFGERGPVRFTMDPTGLTPRRVLVVGMSLSAPGSNLSVDHALLFCQDARTIDR